MKGFTLDSSLFGDHSPLSSSENTMEDRSPFDGSSPDSIDLKSLDPIPTGIAARRQFKIELTPPPPLSLHFESESPTSSKTQSGELTPLARGLEAPNREIPNYDPKQVKSLGKGAFGDTYQVTPHKGPAFVLKEINTARATVHSLGQSMVSQDDIDNHVQKMQVEIKAMEAVRGHPNIVHLMGSDEQSGTLRIAMSIAAGQPLKKAKLTEQKTKLAMRQLVSALDYCHSKGVAHLDVKPDNLLWDEKTNHLTLVDFGEARFMDESGEINSDMSGGTAAYRPMFNSDSNGISVDAYAVGKTCAALMKDTSSAAAQDFIKQCENGVLDSQHPWLLT